MDDIKNIIKNRVTKKAPAYQWQDLALNLIKELSIPNFKRGATFKVCKDNSETTIRQALTDTRELCHGDEKWKYFFKVLGPNNNSKNNLKK